MANQKLKIAYRILGYLVENPNAQDTLEGIVEWWLPSPLLRETAMVKEVLDDLVAANLVLERRGKESRTYYKVNRRKFKEISAILTGKCEIPLIRNHRIVG